MVENRFGTGQELYLRAQRLIPGGTQLLSKRPQMFLPDRWPAYYSRSSGVTVWDLDGNSYIDATHFGVGAPILGFADPDVDSAVIDAIRSGVASTLNCKEEVDLAELLIELHPWADMVRLARGGGECLSIAARVARSATGRDKIAVCGYHGWCDWYLAANLSKDKALDGHLLPGLMPSGVPRGLASTLYTFRYNDVAEVEAIFAAHGHELAAVVMEPARSTGPNLGFLERVRELCTQHGSVLVFDEVTSGWRMNTGGIHLRFGVSPDLAAFAKGMGNGYAISALIGRKNVMEAAQNSFISSTNWTERVGPVAAIAMIRKHQRERVSEHLIQIGEMVQAGWKSAAADAGLTIQVSGLAPLSGFAFELADPIAAATLFTQEMLSRGFLASGQFYSSYAHTTEIVSKYLDAASEVFRAIQKADAEGHLRESLNGPVKHAGFTRLS